MGRQQQRTNLTAGLVTPGGTCVQRCRIDSCISHVYAETLIRRWCRIVDFWLQLELCNVELILLYWRLERKKQRCDLILAYAGIQICRITIIHWEMRCLGIAFSFYIDWRRIMTQRAPDEGKWLSLALANDWRVPPQFRFLRLRFLALDWVYQYGTSTCLLFVWSL